MVMDDLALYIFFFFQAEDGIRDYKVTGLQTCALPISELQSELFAPEPPLSVGRQGLIAIPLEPEAVEPPGAGLEEEVLRRAEGARIEVLLRSEERRVGKECRSRWPP